MAQAGTVWVDVRGDMSQFASDVANGARRAGASISSGLGSGARQVVSDLGTVAGVAGIAVAGIGVAAIKTSSDFNAAMSGVGAVANASAQELDALRDSALQAGAETVFSASQAAEAQAELVKAGVSVSDVLSGALTGSLSLAAAGQLDLASAATISAQAMNVFGLAGDQVGHIADVLAAGANKSAADVGQLGDALRQGGLVAKQTGLSLEETVGVLSMFADNALVGSDAGTSLKTMLQRLVPQSDEAAAEMERLGLSFYDAQGAFVGIESVAGQLQQALLGLDDAQRQQALTTLFGSDAVRGASILMERGAEGVREYTTAVNDMGAAERMAAAQTDNLQGDIEAFSGAVETSLIHLGDLGDSSLRSLTQSSTDLVNVFNDFATTPAWDAIARNVAELTGGAGGVIEGLADNLADLLASIDPSDVDRVFGSITSGLSTLRESVRGAEGVIAGLGVSLAGLGARSVLGPLGAIVPAISPITGVLGGLVLGSESGRDALADLGKQAVGFATGPGARLLDSASELADELSEGLASALSDVGSAAFEAGERLLPVLADALEDLGPPLRQLLEEGGELVAAVLPQLAGLAGTVLPPLVDALSAGLSVAASAVGLLADNVWLAVPALGAFVAIKFADQFKVAGSVISSAAQSVGSFRDALGQIAATRNVSQLEAFKGVAGATAREVGSMAGGFIAANGPLVALTGAATLGAYVFGQYAKEAAAVAEVARDLGEAIRSTKDDFDQRSEATARAAFEDKGALDVQNELGISLADLSEMAAMYGDSLSNLAGRYSEANGSTEIFRGLISDLPGPVQELALSIDELQQSGEISWEQAISFFAALGDLADGTAESMKRARDELSSIAREAASRGRLTADELTAMLERINNAKTPEELNAAFSELNRLLGITADGAQDAGDQLQRLLDLIEKLKNAPRDIDEAARRLAESGDRVRDAFADPTSGAISRGISPDTEAGRRNADAIRQQVEASEKLAEAQALVDTTGQQSVATLVAQRQSLEQLAAQGLITGDELMHLVEIYGLADEDIQATVTADTTDARQKLAEVQAQFDATKADIEEPIAAEIQAKLNAGDYIGAEAMLQRLARDREVTIRATVTTAVGGVVAEVEKVTGVDINANGVVGRASGGAVWPGQLFAVGEQGPELGYFPRNGQIIDAETTKEILSGGAMTLDPLLTELAAMRSELRDAIGGGSGVNITVDRIEATTPETTPRDLVRAALLAKAML